MDNNEKILICACHSFEHQVMLWHDKEFEEDSLYAYFHLTTYRSFWKRLVTGLRYAFGYRSRWGEWDQFIFDKENERALYAYLNKKYSK